MKKKEARAYRLKHCDWDADGRWDESGNKSRNKETAKETKRREVYSPAVAPPALPPGQIRQLFHRRQLLGDFWHRFSSSITLSLRITRSHDHAIDHTIAILRRMLGGRNRTRLSDRLPWRRARRFTVDVTKKRRRRRKKRGGRRQRPIALKVKI